ncbi:hypothetical protein GCM10007890_04240 [Methylobacterium tardum]|uniref:Uncharacterized protein n=1 Tax=Methylobacterium tardum TaxID=374432 RepID=A0AA37WQV7_9HYPH|nr:hypothetical protein GCM10007890_04240 [Methylobacterium tardum]
MIGLGKNTDNRVRPHSSLGYRTPAPVSFPDLAFRLPMAATMQSPPTRRPKILVRSSAQSALLRRTEPLSHSIKLSCSASVRCRAPLSHGVLETAPVVPRVGKTDRARGRYIRSVIGNRDLS